MEELVMTAMVLQSGGEIKLEAEDITTAAEHHLDGSINDTEAGREYIYRARPDSEER
ncbi:unknown [Clostridium sp. CAG:81]|nr:unknown [Clostridium sp. CAG:81]